MTIEQGRDISELFRRVNNLLRVGKVVAVDYATAKAQVKIGNITTDYLPWLTPSTSTWIPLKNGEQVVVLSPCGDLRFGMILPALYQTTKPAPSSSDSVVSFVGDITQTGNKTITGDTTQTGSLTVSADITATGEVQGKGINLSTHLHAFDYNAGPTPASAITKIPS